jgi:hypothetical protein
MLFNKSIVTGVVSILLASSVVLAMAVVLAPGFVSSASAGIEVDCAGDYCINELGDPCNWPTVNFCCPLWCCSYGHCWCDVPWYCVTECYYC